MIDKPVDNLGVLYPMFKFKPIQPEANQASVEELLAKQEEAKKAEEARQVAHPHTFNSLLGNADGCV